MVYEAAMCSLENLFEYLAQHTLTCLIPAFFIAGAIAASVKKDAILNYFGPHVKRRVSYLIAAVSRTVLAVCSCTILPLFASIYGKGSGIGTATAFLNSGPAINILAIVYTAQVLGYVPRLARAVAAISLSLVVGLAMSGIFREHDRKILTDNSWTVDEDSPERAGWVSLLFFILLIAILLVGSRPWDG